MLIILNDSPILNARELCNFDLTRQVNRISEALGTCHRILDGIPGRMRRTHTKFGYYEYQFVLEGEFENFPLVPLMYDSPESSFCKWLISGTSVYEWLISHYYACGREYAFRHSKTHYGMHYLKHFMNYPKNIQENDDVPVEVDKNSVREQYYNDSLAFDWGRRGPPIWWPK